MIEIARSTVVGRPGNIGRTVVDLTENRFRDETAVSTQSAKRSIDGLRGTGKLRKSRTDGRFVTRTPCASSLKTSKTRHSQFRAARQVSGWLDGAKIEASVGPRSVPRGHEYGTATGFSRHERVLPFLWAARPKGSIRLGSVGVRWPRSRTIASWRST